MKVEPEATTLAALLAEAYACQLARLDAETLLTHTLGIARAILFAHPERSVAQADYRRVRAMFERRLAGEPLEYLIGRTAFHAIELDVEPGVLVPRDDTECLVDAVLARTPLRAAHVLDLGTGSGAIALALAHAQRDWRIIAVDRSKAACALAARNAQRLGLTAGVSVREGNWYAPVAGSIFDVVVSNPPYVAVDDPELDATVRRFEPEDALIAGADGLDAIRAILRDVPLRPGGLLAIEHGHRQGEAVRMLYRAHELDEIETVSDLEGRPRATLGRRRGDG